MLDEFDYKEPLCPLSGGEDFYYPKEDAPSGRIPVGRIIEKVDACFNKNDYKEAGRLLVYWRNEAVMLRDEQGELAIENELVGFYRKQNNPDKGIASIKNALNLVEKLNQGDYASGATVLVNCATAYKAFGIIDEALALYRQAEQTYKKVLDKNDSRFGALYNNMALALEDAGDFSKAEEHYFSAVEVMKNVPRGEAEIAITYINLAHLYEKWGKEEKISDCMSKAYDYLLSENLPHNGYYAFVLEKCAPSFGYFGQGEICEKFKKESERIYAGS